MPKSDPKSISLGLEQKPARTLIHIYTRGIDLCVSRFSLDRVISVVLNRRGGSTSLVTLCSEALHQLPVFNHFHIIYVYFIRLLP